MSLENTMLDFLGGTVDRNAPADAGDTGSVPDLGGFHMPQSNESPCTESLCSAAGKATARRS